MLLAVHLLLVRDRRAELLLVLAAGALGFAADTIQGWLGVFQFTSGYAMEWLAPPWIVVMWMQFGGTLRHCLAWLTSNPRLAAALGLLGGPLAFWAGSRLGAMTFGSPLWRSLLSIALVWALALPTLALLTHRVGATGQAKRVGSGS